MSNTIQDLVSHMKEYKDAVVIIGDKLAPEIGKAMEAVKEGEETEQEQIFNRKTLAKEPKKFWKYYFDKIYYTDETVPDVYKAIHKLKFMGLAKTIISTDIRHQPIGGTDLNLRGVSTLVRCSKCDCVMLESGIEDMKKNEEYKCPKCKARLRPDCLLYGENYNPIDVKYLTDSVFKQEEGKEAVPNTHTIILIGVDMQEDLIAEMYDNYLLVRDRIKEPCRIVMITDDEKDIRLFTPEYATVSDVDGSAVRLVNLFE